MAVSRILGSAAVFRLIGSFVRSFGPIHTIAPDSNSKSFTKDHSLHLIGLDYCCCEGRNWRSVGERSTKRMDEESLLN